MVTAKKKKANGVSLPLAGAIELLVKRNLVMMYHLDSEEVRVLMIRIVSSFYGSHGVFLAKLANQLLTEYPKARQIAYSMLLVALDLEETWKRGNLVKWRVQNLVNPNSLNAAYFSELLALSPQQETQIRNILFEMSEEDFRKTPYYKALFAHVYHTSGGTCQMLDIDGEQCGRKENLTILYKTQRYARGLEHRAYNSECALVCEGCLKYAVERGDGFNGLKNTLYGS